MKSILLLATAFLFSATSFAQRTVKLRNLWVKPQVHVLFGHYTVSYAIKDINRALELLAEAGDSTWGATSGLDEGKDYVIDLHHGMRQEYRNGVQPMIQNGIGIFLLTTGKAEIKYKKKRKLLKEVLVDIEPPGIDQQDVVVHAYDPVRKKIVLQGKMKTDMYNKDLGIDY